MIIDQIKSELPKVSSARRGKKGYCVGGAILNKMLAPTYLGYPDAEEVKRALLVLNPKLSGDAASEFAMQIIDLNDEGLFGDAWEAAREAERWS